MTKRKAMVIREDDSGDLFIGGPPNEYDLANHVMLDDHAVWDEYVAACQAMRVASRKVLGSLRKPRRSEVKP